MLIWRIELENPKSWEMDGIYCLPGVMTTDDCKKYSSSKHLQPGVEGIYDFEGAYFGFVSAGALLSWFYDQDDLARWLKDGAKIVLYEGCGVCVGLVTGQCCFERVVQVWSTRRLSEFLEFSQNFT